MYRLAQVTDPHFRSLSGAWPWRFAGKRALGALNIVVSRWRKHKMALLESLGAHLAAEQVDHLAVTGDLGNVALVGEWLAGQKWLRKYAGAPTEVSVIPGNHDTYVLDVVRTAAFERLFQAYQTSDVPNVAAPGAESSPDSRDWYPFVRFRGPLALVAVNSCVPTGDLGAWGEVGAAQLARLERVLTSEPVRSKIRVIIMHHPPVLHRAGENRNLKDRAAFVAMLERTGANLVLHGHDHRDLAATVKGPQGQPVHIVGAGSASYAGPLLSRARYNIYEFGDGGVEVVTYVHDVVHRTFKEAHRRVLATNN